MKSDWLDRIVAVALLLWLLSTAIGHPLNGAVGVMMLVAIYIRVTDAGRRE